VQCQEPSPSVPLIGEGVIGAGMPVVGGRTTGCPEIGTGVTSLTGFGSAIGWSAGGRLGSGFCVGAGVGVGWGVDVGGVGLTTGMGAVGIAATGAGVGLEIGEEMETGCVTGVATGFGAGAVGAVGAGDPVTGFTVTVTGAGCTGCACCGAVRRGAMTRAIVTGRRSAKGRSPDVWAGLVAGSGAAWTEVSSGGCVPSRGVGTLSMRPSKTENAKAPATAPASKIAVKTRSIPSWLRVRRSKTSLESGRKGVVYG
jgi:hypothetical protein